MTDQDNAKADALFDMMAEFAVSCRDASFSLTRDDARLIALRAHDLRVAHDALLSTLAAEARRRADIARKVWPGTEKAEYAAAALETLAVDMEASTFGAARGAEAGK